MLIGKVQLKHKHNNVSTYKHINVNRYKRCNNNTNGVNGTIGTNVTIKQNM